MSVKRKVNEEDAVLKMLRYPVATGTSSVRLDQGVVHIIYMGDLTEIPDEISISRIY